MKLLPLLFLTPLFAMAESTTLQQQLDARAAESATQLPAGVREEFAKGITAVKDAGITAKAKNAGDKAPAFTLKNAAGKDVSLGKLLENGPVILTWYRGGWCPYCNLTLSALQEKLPEFKKAGAQLVALTPELPDKSLDTTQKNHLEFEVLTDLNHGVAKQFGLLFKLTPEVAEIYKGFFNLDEHNGADAGNDTLPLAATYIINTDGTIKWAFLDADYRKRAEPAEILKQLTN